MAADYKTNLNALVAASACYQECWSEEQMMAVDLYVRAQELAGAAGQPNYTGNAGLAKLMQDAAQWNNFQLLSCAAREAISLYLDIQNAAFFNTGFTATDKNSLSAASTCYQCLPWETKKNLLLFLKWRLNSITPTPEPE